MNLKETLQNLKSSFNYFLGNRDYEFEAELEDHPLGERINKNIYRLYFIDYHRIGEDCGRGPDNIGMIDWPFKPFMLPDDMSREDAFKVLSYLTDFIEKSSSLQPGCYKSVDALDKVIDLERLGFKRLNINLDHDSEEVIDLFTIKGRVLLFKQSRQYEKYFEWYTEGVSFDEVKEIYNKCGIEFYDLVPAVQENDDSLSNNPKLVKVRKIN